MLVFRVWTDIVKLFEDLGLHLVLYLLNRAYSNWYVILIKGSDHYSHLVKYPLAKVELVSWNKQSHVPIELHLVGIDNQAEELDELHLILYHLVHFLHVHHIT